MDLLNVAIISVVAFIVFVYFFIRRKMWVQSQPNQWLLIIGQGRLKKCGIGLKTYKKLTDSYVIFPSRVERVQFQANNVTKQMQGMIITGFAFWSVYRDDDGPFRCYKYMQGGNTNDNVKAMCESALRNLIANSKMEEVLRNRNHLRDNIKNELKDLFKGWGVWLETVEITDVKISSDKLFKDLQAQFRQQTYLKAKQIELSSQQTINQARVISQLKISQAEQLNETRKHETKNHEKIKREQQEAEYQMKKNELQVKRLQRETYFQIEKIKNESSQERQRLKNIQQIQRLKLDFQLEFSRKRLQLDKQHNETSFKKYQIDSTERIYKQLGIREIKINQFTSEQNTSLASLLPQMGYNFQKIDTLNRQ